MFRIAVLASALAVLACGTATNTPAPSLPPETGGPGVTTAPPEIAVNVPATAAEQQAPEGGAPRSLLEGETREQMLARLGFSLDPGLNPDEGKVWKRQDGTLVQIHRHPADDASYQGVPEGMVRPFGWAAFTREVFQLNDEWIWVLEPVEIYEGEALSVSEALMRRSRARREADPMGVKREQAEDRGWNEEQIGYVRAIRPDFELLEPRRVNRTVRFRNSSEGLPQTGSWRNSGTFADMNGDGKVDVVVPPPRGGGINAVPVIYLGDGGKTWEPWMEASFPVPTDYGSVAAADLNKDGFMDVVMGIHLTGVGIYLGGPDGYFIDASPKLKDTQFDTRRAIIVDVNRDGHLDVVAVNEGLEIFGGRRRVTPHPSHVIAFINDGTGTKWRQVDVAEIGRTTASDWLSAANLNGDEYPDFASGSMFFNGPDVMYMSDGPLSWKGFGRGWIPFQSYYGGLATGQFDERTETDEVVFAFARTWPLRAPLEVPERMHVSGIEVISWNDRGEASRTPIMRVGERAVIRALGSGDFDGDGNLDVVFLQPEANEFVLLLGDGRGGFARGTMQGLEASPNALYDITVGDANADGRPDLLLLYERETTSQGSVQVWLNEK